MLPKKKTNFPERFRMKSKKEREKDNFFNG